MSGYYNRNSWSDDDKNSGNIAFAIKMILLFILVVYVLTVSQSCDRDKHNMKVIKDGYCYEEDTFIIYIEEDSGRNYNFIYVPYYNSDGNLCKYDVETGEWIGIEKK